MVKNHAFIEVRDKKLLDESHPEKSLIMDIVKELKKLGIECSEIKTPAFCVTTICKIGDSEIVITLFQIEKNESRLSGYSSIICVNAVTFPWWRRLLTRIPEELYDSGESLQYVCDQIGKILSSDNRIGKVSWMTREEKRGKNKGENN